MPSYACSAVGNDITSCSGTTAVGAPIDTSTLGSHSFTVNSEDSDGVTASQTVTYSVVAPAAAMCRAAVDRRRRADGVGVARGQRARPAQPKGKKPPPVTTFSFTLNEAGDRHVHFSHRVGGRRAHSKCVAPFSAKNKHKRGMQTDGLPAGTLKFSGHAGVNKVRFGPLSPTAKSSSPARYTLQDQRQGARPDPRPPPSALRLTIVK